MKHSNKNTGKRKKKNRRPCSAKQAGKVKQLRNRRKLSDWIKTNYEVHKDKIVAIFLGEGVKYIIHHLRDLIKLLF